MLQIKNTLGGGKPEGLYVWKKNGIGSEPKEFNKSVSTLPYDFYEGCAVVLNEEIHILGGYGSNTSHYKWNGSSWAKVSTLPYNFYEGCAVILNGEIHILGTSSTSANYASHYKWNGSSWTKVSTLPYNFYEGCAVVLNGEIHLLGSGASSSYYKYHYKWDGSSWTEVSTLPYNFYRGCAVVLGGELHILGGAGGNKNHYKWDGSSWTSVSTLPYEFYDGCAVIFDGEIHILGTYYTAHNARHYKWDGELWSSVNTLPYSFYDGSAVVFDGGIHILSSSDNSSYYQKHYLVIGNIPVYTFLNYVVSDKETAYPDGGEKGGYWYERVVDGLTPEMFGCTKCETGTFTVSSNTYTSPEISHSLGIIPRFAIVWRITPAANADKSFIYSVAYAIAQNSGGGKYGFGEIYASGSVNYSNGYNGNTSTSYFTSTKVIFNASPYSSNSYTYFKSGETYNYVLLG